MLERGPCEARLFPHAAHCVEHLPLAHRAALLLPSSLPPRGRHGRSKPQGHLHPWFRPSFHPRRSFHAKAKRREARLCCRSTWWLHLPATVVGRQCLACPEQGAGSSPARWAVAMQRTLSPGFRAAPRGAWAAEESSRRCPHRSLSLPPPCAVSTKENSFATASRTDVVHDLSVCVPL